MSEKAAELEALKYDSNIIYEETASIGKRYVRQDLIGTPFCIAVDQQTLEDNFVTIRHRDTMEQERVAISDLHGRLNESCSFRKIFEMI